MSREKELVKNMFVISFGTVLPKLLSMVSLPLITDGLSKAEFGTFDLISVLESLFLPCITLQIQTAAFRFLLESRDDDSRTSEIVTNVIGFVVVSSLLGLSILFICLTNLSYGTRLLICSFFLLYVLMNALQQIARGTNKNLIYSISSVVYSAVNVLMIVICVAMKDMGLTGALISLVMAGLAAVVVLVIAGKFYTYFSISLMSRQVVLEMIQYSWPMIPNSISIWVMNLSDRLVLTIILGPEVEAVYAVANKIPSLFTVVQSTFSLAWQENASIASKDQDAGAYYTAMFDSIFNLMVGVMAVLIAATPVLFWLLIKGDYSASYDQMPILFMGIFFSCIVAFLGGIYVAYKKTISVGLSTFFGAVLNLTIDLLFVNSLGIYAASISTLVSFIGLAIYRMNDIRKFTNMSFKWKKIVLMTGILMLMCQISFAQVLWLNICNVLIAFAVAIPLNKSLIIVVYGKIRALIHK